MTAVAQTYQNYLGGLNEQPDEVKKPGQLVEAVNVIPDATQGLVRRKGFELITWKEADGTPIPSLNLSSDPDGTWFEIDYANPINQDYTYFGCVNKDGSIAIFNQNGEKQAVRYATESIIPHKKYLYNSGRMEVFDDNGDLLQSTAAPVTRPNSYFRNTPENPLKYCVSKNHIVFTNTTVVPTLAQAQLPTDEQANKYYSFLNLKVIDTANYNYTFRRFYSDDITEEYSYIKSLELDAVEDLGDGYDQDLTLPLQVHGPFRFDLEPNDPASQVKEDAVVEVTFRGQIVQFQSSDSGDYRNEARYSWSVRVIDPGKGFREGPISIVMDAPPSDEIDDLPDLLLTFNVKESTKVTATKNELIVPDDLSNNDSAEDILLELASKFKAAGIDKVLVVGSGLYLENAAPFSISTSEIAVADVLNSQKVGKDLAPIVRVNTVAELPVECYAGFIAEITNSFDSQSNYFLEYTAESQSDADLTSPLLTKSDGYWKEVAKPWEQTTINTSTMPHMITMARETDQTRYAFVVSPIQYESRTAGTAKDNPSMFVDSARITDINYYKNRLFFLTGEGTVVSSVAGEINNLFITTAIEVSPTDPIDLIANSNQKVAIHGSSIVNNAMVLFGDTEQYTLSTNDSLLTSETASLTKIANFTFDPVSRPIYLGTNLGFISKGVKKFYEMTNIYDRGPVDINERSQQIQKLIGEGFNIPVSSREQSLSAIYKQHNGTGFNRMLIYKFRQESSQESSQTSWVEWTTPDPICHVSLPRDKMFVVTHSSSGFKLLKLDPKVASNYKDEYNSDEQGVGYETRITFPTIYPRGESSSDYTSNLTVHRLKMSTANIGAYDLTINRMGYDTYEMLVEQTPADEYESDSQPIYDEHIETIPVYTRNKNLNITMSTSYNAPLILRSMTWEGDWNPPFYKRV
jgi:diaminopimelate epimerase